MSKCQYNTPKSGGAARIKDAYLDQKKRKPSKALLDILKQKPQKKEHPDKKVAKPLRRTPAVEF